MQTIGTIWHIIKKKKENILTKIMIFQMFHDDDDLLWYIPTYTNLKVIPRDFVLSILANIRREKYAKLYSKNKEIKAQKATGGSKVYKAQITNQFLAGQQNFTPHNL